MLKRLNVGQIIIVFAVPVVILATMFLMGLFGGEGAVSEDEDSTFSEIMLFKVPNVINLTEAQARTKLEEHFLLSIEYTHNDTVTGDRVIMQSLDYGSMVEEGSKITVIISLGPVMVTVPDLIGMDKEEAVALLDKMGIECFLEEIYHESAKIGTICFQSISGGKNARKDTRIKLNVSKGKINIQSISFYSDTYVAIGKSVGLYYNPSPQNYQSKLIWLSDDTSVATVENGVVAGISEGTTVISVWSEDDESICGSCMVTVFEDGLIVLTDYEIEQVVRMEIRKPEGDIFKSDVYNMIFLGDYWVNLKASSLADLVYFPNVKDIWINSEELNELEPLIYCKKLEYLVITRCAAEDISVISELTELKSLSLNNFKIINPEPLKKLSKLEYLSLDNVGLSDISFLLDLTNLKSLSLRDNNIRYINAISSLNNLSYLCLDNNKIKDITPLGELKNLSYLWLENNRIKDITPLSTCKSLLLLKARNNQIKDISPLLNCEIHYLYLRENFISDLTPLSGYATLETLDISFNNITNIEPLSDCIDLYHLFIQGNKMNDISSLYNISGLRYLYIWNTEISEEQITDFMQVNHDCTIFKEEFEEEYY